MQDPVSSMNHRLYNKPWSIRPATAGPCSRVRGANGVFLMLLELSVSVKGKHGQASVPSVDIKRIIDASGLHYKKTSTGTVLEGSWEQLMAVAKKCHDEVRKKHDRFITHMKAVDRRCADAPAPLGCSGRELEEVLEDEGEWLML